MSTRTNASSTSHNRARSGARAAHAAAQAEAEAEAATGSCNLRAVTLRLLHQLLRDGERGVSATQLSQQLWQHAHDGDTRARRNARRRMYDALQVLRALRMVSGERRVRWTGGHDGARLMRRLVALSQRRVSARRALALRTLAMVAAMERGGGGGGGGGGGDSGGQQLVRMPFVVLRVGRGCELSVEASVDARCVVLSLRGGPFQLINDAGVVVRAASKNDGSHSHMRGARAGDGDLNSRPQDCLAEDYETCALPTELM